MKGTLFPKYLNQGSKGRAVMVLQIILTVLGFGDENLECTGIYDVNTANAVRRLQVHCGFTGENVDGNFGPDTRLAFLARYKININLLPIAPFLRKTEVVEPVREAA